MGMRELRSEDEVGEVIIRTKLPTSMRAVWSTMQALCSLRALRAHECGRINVPGYVGGAQE